MSKNLRAFTLIELLVVIVIIAFLVSILVSQLQKPCEPAWSAVCGDRLRNVNSAALHLYAEDHSGRVPQVNMMFYDGYGYHRTSALPC